MLHSLFSDDNEEARKLSRQNSVLPFQPQDPSTCPWALKGSYDPADARSYSAVLFLLAPVQEDFVRRAFPQVVNPAISIGGRSGVGV